jgi:hypothetical protein
MRKALTVAASFVLVTNVVGCGDTPAVLVHDLLVFWNELADRQIRVIDEPSAKEADAIHGKAIKLRNEALKDRMAKKFNTLAKDKDMQKELREAWADYWDEAAATAKRLHKQYKRLDDLCNNISSDDDKKELIKVRDWVRGYLLPVRPPPLKDDAPPDAQNFDVRTANPIFTGKGEDAKGHSMKRWGAGLLPEPPLPKNR